MYTKQCLYNIECVNTNYIECACILNNVFITLNVSTNYACILNNVFITLNVSTNYACILNNVFITLNVSTNYNVFITLNVHVY